MAKIILVENGSSDGSFEILQKNENPQLVITRIEVANKCIARNVGAKLATTRFVTFLDQDDEILSIRSQYLDHLIDKEWNVVIGTQRFVMSEIGLIPPYFRTVIDGDRPLYHPITLVMERDQFLEIGGFNEKHKYAEDFELMTRINEAGLRVKYVQEASLIRHFHDENDSRNIDLSRKELFKVLRQRTHWTSEKG